MSKVAWEICSTGDAGKLAQKIFIICTLAHVHLSIRSGVLGLRMGGNLTIHACISNVRYQTDHGLN